MLFSSMDGLLFNPQTMADVNGNSKIMNAELEVKKLQELVRKLERQNEQLRTRANAVNNCTSGGRLGPDTGSYCLSSSYSPSFGPSEEHYPYFHPQSVTGADEEDATVLDEVEILDLRVVLPIDGESDYIWLYVSPKAKLFPHLLLSPLQWCRHVLDNPRPEVELAKRSLCYKLDQAKRWRGVLSSSALYSPVDELSALSSCSKPYTKPALTEQTADLPSPNHQKTLTGRNCSSLNERSPTFLYHTATQGNSHHQRPLSPQSSIDSDLSVSELEDDSISMSYKLQDMTDVEVMARLQEESLRQEYASTTATATRRSASFSVHTGARRSMRSEAELEEEEEYDQLSAPQPRLFRTSSMQRSTSHSQSLSSMRECRRSPSTPQYLSSLSYQQLHMPNLSSSTATETQSYRAHTDKLRRSMPNLLRAPSIPSVISVPSVPAPAAHVATSSSSLSLLRNSQSFDSHSGLTKIQSAIPCPGQLQQRVQSVGNFSTRPPLKATAYVSPTIQSATTMPSSVSLSSIPSSSSSSSSIPLPSKPSAPSSTRSALPRPASFVGTSGVSRSKIGQPMRSLLTPPKSVSALSALRDGSWRDGCY
ncbi:SLAIN motif-containing protein 1a isoform X3 [Carassius carassius]|uniref:SLAIN motif-containing protein 1a isoform X3 n=1 Tax=Carassius carassius TaxID=217509 RepID=UPI002868FA28|nr:SLAIN motif-containing protein 1a isoform X3 [Carassius carassius]